MELRKVVKLRVYDLPQKKSTINKEESSEIAFGYTWRNRYYIGKEEIHKSASYNSEQKERQPLLFRINGIECNNDILRLMVGELIDSEESIEEEITDSKRRAKKINDKRKKSDSQKAEDEGYIYYVNEDGSLISYFGSHIEEFEEKILRKSLNNRSKR